MEPSNRPISFDPNVDILLAEILSFFYDYYHTEGLTFREKHCLLQECVISPLLNRPGDSFLALRLIGCGINLWVELSSGFDSKY